ncbi:DUF4124 domain-containing protein [Janthinobacterium sp. PC23-8]|uniref:DUF4124 domain-containing protein n=1 Tax=Janthinobacterium sp. PC23-8 TaxID=2012679 RepID=UPI000B97A820|nr:DUF4124 domain-containing protein [Janthinobacterium sp. PC23-8]OYO29039.1 hypothetical protein CD932_18110 [Janthinobacterium sp. PC23-8]
MKAIIALMLCAAAGAASAQTVYKCVQNGQTSYSETPCTAGQLQIIDVPPAPPVLDKGAATRQQRVASQLESMRKQREAREDQARARGAQQGAAHEKRCAQLRLEQQWAAQDAVGAGDKNRDAAQTRVRRAGEKLAIECLH